MPQPGSPAFQRARCAEGAEPRMRGQIRRRDQRAKGAYLRSLRYALGVIWSVRPAYVLLNLLNVLWNVPTRMFDVLIMQYVVNTALGGGGIRTIAVACAAYAALMLARHASSSFLVRGYNVAAEDCIRSDIQLRLHEQARSIDLAAFDTRKFYDDYARALDVLDERIVKCFKDLTAVLECVVSILTLGSVMAVISPALILIVAVGCGLSAWSYSRRSRIMVRRVRAITPLLRRFQYLNDLYYQRRFAKDVRTERIDEIASADHRRCTRELDAEDRKWGARSAGYQFVGLSCGALTDCAMYLYLAWGVIAGRLDAGSFMALWNAAAQFSTQLRSLFRGLPELGETCLLINDARGFDTHRSTLAEPPSGEALPAGPAASLALEGVTFGYAPGAPVLRDVSFEARRGQTVAIVGHNGAGKSTIAKLLLRLYDPDEGRILLNGEPYSRYAKADLRAHVAVVFQDYQHYAYSVAENVLMRPLEGEADRRLVRWALDQVGLLRKVEGFQSGIDAPVTKEFSSSGELFSGGELQRLAIARALAKDAPVVVLDEPSSALDPIAEREVIDLMARLFADRICIVVSHRLSMTRDADCILVMDQGEIVERGPHDVLVHADGLYQRMWEAQADKYA